MYSRGITEKTPLNLFSHGARYFDPQLALWHSPDPLPESSTHLSPYTYVTNNPVNFVDPNGMLYAKPSDWEREQAKERAHCSAIWWKLAGMMDRPEFWTAVPTFEDQYMWIEGPEGGAYVRRTDVTTYYGAEAQAYCLATLDQSDRYNVEYYGVDKYGSTDILIEDLVGGSAKVYKMAFWQISGYKYNPLYVLDGYLAYGHYEEAINLTMSEQSSTRSGIGVAVVGGLLTAEDAYNNFLHNHSTYRTTQGKWKNIFKSNGEVRSARAQKFATRSKVVKWTGVVGTAWMTGRATYNVVSDISSNQQISGWDIADSSVGLVGLTGTGLSWAGVISTPIGWGIGAGVAAYSWFSFWYEMGATYGPLNK